MLQFGKDRIDSFYSEKLRLQFVMNYLLLRNCILFIFVDFEEEYISLCSYFYKSVPFQNTYLLILCNIYMMRLGYDYFKYPKHNKINKIVFCEKKKRAENKIKSSQNMNRHKKLTFFIIITNKLKHN